MVNLKKGLELSDMNRSHKSIVGIKIFSVSAAILWMTLVFHLSSQNVEESNQLSSGVTKMVGNIAGIIAPEASIEAINLNHIIRKGAHFLIYFVLGMLITNIFERSRVKRHNIVLALLLCIFYAISDEIHQIFVSGRGPGMKDIFIDSAGAMVGIMVYLLTVQILIARRITNRYSNSVLKK